MRNEALFRQFTAFASACAAAMLSSAPIAPEKASAAAIVVVEKNLQEYKPGLNNANAVKSGNAA